MKCDTAATVVYTHNFGALKFERTVIRPPFSLPPDQDMFYGYVSLVQALNQAKKGAQTYIEKLINEGEQSLPQLWQYRFNHYEDLCVNLLNDNIRRLDARLKIDENYHWVPYRIHL